MSEPTLNFVEHADGRLELMHQGMSFGATRPLKDRPLPRFILSQDDHNALLRQMARRRRNTHP